MTDDALSELDVGSVEDNHGTIDVCVDGDDVDDPRALVDYDPRDAAARARLMSLGWVTLDPRALRTPSSAREVRLRLAHNLPLYAPVYCGASTLLLFVAALTNPVLLASWALVALAWFVYGVWGDPQAEGQLRGVVVTPLEKRLILGVVNLVAVVWGGILSSVAWVAFVGLVLSAAHAATRRIEPRPEGTSPRCGEWTEASL